MNKTPNWTIAVATLAALCAVLLSATLPAWAQEQDEAVADPPGRVGRISALIGAVDISRYAGDAWEPAQINQPVTGQTALRSPPGSQAEVRIGSTSVRLDADTQAVFSQLDDHAIAIDVAQGTVRVRLRSLPTGDAFSLAADAVRAEAQAPGDYRVSYDPDLRAYTLRALAGELRVVTPTNSYNLEAGQESLVEDGGQSVQLHAMGERDDFDAWAEARDGQQDALSSARYVSPETTGIEALDEHGRWNVTEEYGPVWYPRAVPSGWAPYRYGHWAHVHPWGWTWVDDAPWGFAPFHYGRWALIDSRWGWVPGPMVARPVWSPALVGYVGGYSGGVSVSIGIGSPVGWFPLGPHEIYHPPFRYSQRYWDHVNWRRKHKDGGHDDHWGSKGRHDDAWRQHRDHDRDGGDRDGHGDRDDRRMTRQPVPGYRYAKRADALTVVRADDFRGSRSVASQRLRLDAGQIAQLAPMAPGVRLPTVLPRLGSNAAAGGGPVSPVLRLPEPLRRERAESPRRDGREDGALARQRKGEPPRDESRPERATRDDGGGDRRMVIRPPVSSDDPRLGRANRLERRERPEGLDRSDRRAPAERAARSDRDSRLQPVPGMAPAVTPLPGRAVTGAPQPAAPRRNVQAPLDAGRATAPQRSITPVAPRPAVTQRHEAPPRRAVAPLPERRMQAPRAPQTLERHRMERAPAQPRAIAPPRMRAVTPSRAPAGGFTAPLARPSPAASPRRAMEAPRGAGGRARSGGQGGASRGGRATAR